MKFLMAVFVFLMFTLLISWGIVLLMHGTPWLLVATMALFIGLFAKYGCLSSHD
ncbi:MAG TPA: hypothetical protein VK742_06055 [Candidatus Sulfotelmatobacter sp.]|jgi:hypothetical protein|nr:hypothetical protein [Candidatus Sulfotelmatobacter sp.]